MSAPEMEPAPRGDESPSDRRSSNGMSSNGEYRRRALPRGSLIVRSLMWIAISLGFLVWNLWRIVQMHALGLPIRWWGYVQVVLWVIALGFWLRTGWRDFERRGARRG